MIGQCLSAATIVSSTHFKEETNYGQHWSNRVTTCVAPQDIAERFSNELNDAELAKITDSFVESEDFFDNGEYETAFRIWYKTAVGMHSCCDVANRTEGQAVLYRTIIFKAEGWG
jgi:hypothetical protein